MAEMNINNAAVGDNQISDYSVDSVITDAGGDQDKNTWTNENFSQQLGYYTKIPELNAAIDAKATWTVGKGLKADEETLLLLDTIKGNGVDTFNSIIENMIRTYYIAGDSYAEIIKDTDGTLINLKPLSPLNIQIEFNRKGIITGYNQLDKKGHAKRHLPPEAIFHLSRNRVADQIHGTSVIDAVENIILARNESIEDYRQVMHRFVKPRFIFQLDTDDESEIAAFKTKMDADNANGENLYVPKGAVTPELMSVAPNSTLDPKAWIDAQGDYFYEAVGTPQIIIGGSGEFTEASAKIAYLAWQQNVEEEQLFIEEQLLSQINIVIELEFPASLENELLSDTKKDGAQNIDASETTAGEGQ